MIIQIAGYLSGVVALVSFVPYIKSIFEGKTKPERASWIIWAALSLTAFFPQLYKGASYSLFMTGAAALGDFLIFLFAIKYGIGGLLKRDIIALVGLILGLSLWYITKEAALALYIVILIDATGAVLTIVKTYQYPESENMGSWWLTFFAAIMACVAVGSFNAFLLSYPLYVALASLSILASIYLGFRKQKILSFKDAVKL